MQPAAGWGIVEGGEASREPGPPAESREKLSRLRAAMAAGDLDAVYLERWANVAWLCGGRGSRPVLDSPRGGCGVVVGHNGAWLLVPGEDEARNREEAFVGLDLPVVVQPWTRPPLSGAAGKLLPPGARVASDVAYPDAVAAEPLLAPLRRRLGQPEAARYRALGADAAEALEAALTEAGAGWSELEVAGTITAALKARDMEASAVLVGGAARAERFRRLVPTAALVGDGVLASITATRHGLHASCTRALAVGDPGNLRSERFAAAREVERALLRASLPGAALGDLLDAAGRAYAACGYYDEWKEHDQGGTTGYAAREVLALPGSDLRVEAGMAVAWNPTVPGARSEDTFLVREEGLEWLTRAPGSAWPLDEGDGELPRTGVLCL